jgi:type I restriction enzyme, S subunit
MGEIFEREGDRGELDMSEGLSEWQEYKFSDVLIDENISYGIVQPGFHTEIDSVPVVRVNNIKNGKIKIDDVLKVSSEIEKKYLRTRLEGGELLITVVGSVGECAIVPESLKGWNVARAVSVARIKEEFDKRFVKYCFKSEDLKFQMYGNTNDTVQPTLNLSSLKELVLNIPPLPEQKAIASILSSLDNKIDLLHRQNRTLEAIAKTLFRQWFIEEAQEDWEEVTIGDFVEINHLSVDKYYSHQIIKYLDTGSLTDGRIEDLQTFELSQSPSRAKRLVLHNDILISTVRPNQKHYGIIKNPIDNLVVSTGFCVLTCKSIDPHFIYLLLTRNEMTEYLHSIAEGSTSTYPSLKPSDIGSIVFQLPPYEKLTIFSKISHNSWGKIARNHIQICTLEKLRNNLLPKLMSGEVRVEI